MEKIQKFSDNSCHYFDVEKSQKYINKNCSFNVTDFSKNNTELFGGLQA